MNYNFRRTKLTVCPAMVSCSSCSGGSSPANMLYLLKKDISGKHSQSGEDIWDSDSANLIVSLSASPPASSCLAVHSIRSIRLLFKFKPMILWFCVHHCNEHHMYSTSVHKIPNEMALGIVVCDRILPGSYFRKTYVLFHKKRVVTILWQERIVVIKLRLNVSCRWMNERFAACDLTARQDNEYVHFLEF